MLQPSAGGYCIPVLRTLKYRCVKRRGEVWKGLLTMVVFQFVFSFQREMGFLEGVMPIQYHIKRDLRYGTLKYPDFNFIIKSRSHGYV